MALIDLSKLTVKNHVGSTFKLEATERIILGNLVNLKADQTFNGKAENGKLTLSVRGRDSVKINEEELSILKIELTLSENTQECELELLALRGGVDINSIITSLGYKTKEEYINMEGVTADFRKSMEGMSQSEINRVGDKFDIAEIIHIRVGSDNNWHLAFTVNKFNKYQMFVCTHLGIPEVEEEEACALIKVYSNRDKRFEKWANSYAPDLDFDKLQFDYSEGSTIQSAKKAIDYSDRGNVKFMEWMTVKKAGVQMPAEIIAGDDFYVIKQRISQIYNIYGFQKSQFDQFSEFFLSGKLYKDRLEMQLQPRIGISTNMLALMFPEDSNLRNFFDSKLFSAEIFIENLLLDKDGVCVSISFGSSINIIANKYGIEKSVIKICDIGGAIQASSVYNEEICFGSKALMNIEYNEDIGRLVLSGKLMIVEAKQLFSETSTFLPPSYGETIQHLSNFPISNLQHHYQYTISNRFIRFEGTAILYNTKFTMQVIYRLDDVPSPTAMCLELDVDISDDSKKRQDVEESTVDAVKIDDSPKPISLSSFTAFLLKKKDIAFNAVTKFGFLRVSFQDDVDIYNRLNLESDETYKCANIVKKLNEKNIAIELTPNTPRIFMSASKADYGCTEGAKEENKLCNYLKNALGLQNQRFSDQKFYGYLKPTMMKMKAWYPEDKALKIHDRFTIKELTQTIGFDESETGFQGNQFHGKGEISSQTSFLIDSYLSIVETSLYFNAPQYTPFEPFGLVDALYVKTKIVFSDQHIIEIGDNMNLVFQGDVVLGPQQSMEFGGENDIVEQYLHSEATKDKFLACRAKGSTSKSLKEIAESFNIYLTQSVLDVTITDVCFTSNGEDTIWNITSVGILAEKGLWLHAKTSVEAISKFGTVETFIVNVKMKCTGDNKRIIFGRPPLYFYRIKTPEIPEEDTLMDNQELDFKVVLSKSRESKDVGPDIVITIDDKTGLTPTLQGYITTVAFEGPVALTMEKTDYTTFEFLRKPVKAKKRAENEKPPLLTEGFEVKGSLELGQDNIQFQFTGQGLVDRIKQSYSLLVEGKKNFYVEKNLEHTKLQGIITRDSTVPTSKASKKNELENMYRKIQSIKGNFRKEERKKFQPCSICKAVKAPGFIWDSCHISDRVGKVSCLQFKKDALKACDTECLAKCDLNKVDAEETAEAIQQDLFHRSEVLGKLSQETAIYDSLKADLKKEEGNRKILINIFQNKFETFDEISKCCPIENIKTDWVDFSNFKRSDTLDFTLVFPGRYGNTETVRPYVVDGYLPSRVAEYYFNDKHGTNAKNIETAENNVQISFGKSLTLIRDWEIENRDALKKIRRKRPKTISKQVKRTYDDLRAYESQTSSFDDEPLSRNVVLKKYAPWNVLRRSNPFIYTNKTVNTAKRMKVSKSASFCTNRRNRIRDYKDMVKYMKSWSDSFDQANMFLRHSKTLISNGINDLAAHMLHKRSLNNGTFSQKKQRISKKWVNRLKAGFTNWENEFQHQLASYYTTSPKIMFKEMNQIFTPAEFKSLQSFLQSAPSNALSRSITPDPPLQLIGQTLLNGFASMKTLDDNKNFVNQLTNMINQAEQSNQHCHDEL